MTDQIENKEENQIKVETQKAKKTVSIKTVDNPVRNLPKVINEVLNNNISVILTKNGYYVEGFYGINPEGSTLGYIFAQETTEQDTLVFIDAKGHKHYVKSFQDLVSLNSIVWGQFYKSSEEYKKPNAKWFGFMLEMGVLNITPGK